MLGYLVTLWPPFRRLASPNTNVGVAKRVAGDIG
jgi:hypothetical protein